MHQISTKDGRNIPKACENLGLKYLPCVAHSLHLIVGAVLLQKKEEILEEDWMFEGNKPNAEKLNGIRFAGVKASDEEIDSLWTEIDTLVDSTSVNCEELETVRCVVHRFRKLAVFFVRSQKGALRLKTLCYSTRSNIRDMPMDCPTKWRSTIMMLSHLIQLRPALDAFFEYLHSDAGMNEFSELTRTKLYSPTEEDWVTIQCLEELLLQFDALTKEMRRSKYSSLALALPAIRALRTMLLDREMFDQVLSFVQVEELKSRVRCTMLSVSRSFAKLLDASFEDLSAEMSWISLLDPRFTDTKLLTATEKREAEERLVAEMFTTARSSTSTTNVTVNPVPVSEDLERPNKKRRAAYWEQLYGGRSAAQETAADTDSVLLDE